MPLLLTHPLLNTPCSIMGYALTLEFVIQSPWLGLFP